MKKINIVLPVISGATSLLAFILVLSCRIPIADEGVSKLVIIASIGAYLSLLVIFLLFTKKKLLVDVVNVLTILAFISFINSLRAQNLKLLELNSVNLLIASSVILSILVKMYEVLLLGLVIIKKIFKLKTPVTK